MTTQHQLQHLYWRAGFGPRPADVAAGLTPRKALRQLFQDSARFEPLDSAAMRVTETLALSPSPTPDLTMDPQAIALKSKAMTAEQRKLQNRQIREAFYAMNSGWLARMATSPAQLREKMTFFWHGHFACRVRRPDAALQLNNTLRQGALGKFGDLLLSVSQEPAMLQFLNNQQNRRQHPNENFAREVMELFTIGRGQYSEQDIKEAARAFTGWGYDAAGRFVFRARQHDDGSKTFLGQTGNFGGEDILRIILEQPRTAEFLTTKIYRFFVNDTPDPAHIQPLARAFFQSHYDIGDLLERLFSAPWFYDAANVGTRIKSPIELLTGMRRTLGLELENQQPLIVFQKALGQTLFQPPNVAGWPGGRSWIDSSSLVLRLQLPQVLLRNAEFSIALKEDENDLAPSVSKAERTFRQGVKARVQLAPISQLLAKTAPGSQAAQLSTLLLQIPIRPENLALIQQQAAAGPADSRLRTMVTSMLSLPEYQLM
ncbi:Uncharacterized conserved protein, DUF1800 family [Hymenobacter daecheongensis DSM 21074]|uniref:Uncharacterized conserved protein, DUF1800 family n=1 Tax=Hymenobacter daecheongensis DSM 21074 TaxID=1121955 RepID=A0A1M6LIN3_9BACT|nr:DUF1800 domain-containing protein [Hymenobacter daecheongensis]SHJ71034.1 Uncharacterized conserved protein, DUF1800 family [Hymenobacter daecheongensis DSM 21074]